MKNFVIPILLCAVFLGSCRKSDRDFDESILASQDEIANQLYLSNAFHIIDDAARKAYGMTPSHTSGQLDCATVIENLIGSPNTISIDFGTGCSGTDGRTRKGQIYCTIDDNYSDSATVVNASFINYYVDDVKFDGSVKITNMGNNSNGKLHYTYSYNDLKITRYNPEKTATFNGNGTRVLYDDLGTASSNDDIYWITGNFSGRSVSGNIYEAETTFPLTFEHGCKYISGGNMTVTPGNLVPRFLDFGSAECDSLIVITISQTKHAATQP